MTTIILKSFPVYKSTKPINENKTGGGICILTRDDFKVKLRDDRLIIDLLLRITIVKWKLCLFIEMINEKSKNIITGTIYRPPNNRFNELKMTLKPF